MHPSFRRTLLIWWPPPNRPRNHSSHLSRIAETGPAQWNLHWPALDMRSDSETCGVSRTWSTETEAVNIHCIFLPIYFARYIHSAHIFLHPKAHIIRPFTFPCAEVGHHRIHIYSPWPYCTIHQVSNVIKVVVVGFANSTNTLNRKRYIFRKHRAT